MTNTKTLTMVILTYAITTISYAEEFCVTSSVELITALIIAEQNQEANTIRIKKGTYIAPIGGFKYITDKDDDIEISGGWVSLLNDPCNFQLPNSPAETFLDGNSENRVMDISIGAIDAVVSVSGIGFMNGYSNVDGDKAAGLRINASQLNSNSSITLENNSFVNNTSELSAGLELNTSAGLMIVRNNLFTLNHSTAITDKYSPTTFIINPDNSQKLYFTNNTVVDNVGGGTFIFQAQDSAKALIANNIFWKNGGVMDLELFGSGYDFLRHNNIGIQTGSPADEQFGNVSEMPLFEAGSMNFTPSVYSTAVGGGIRPPDLHPIPIPFELDWNIGTTDLEGNLRWQGFEIDMGAVESPHTVQQAESPIFENGFEAFEE
ncbi:right-handed parallel beta-helix repeat-containing protein [Marinicella sp. W31]|uniref:right-handed parallel beta-helix repeat-containing protein n=1 Tax=Marinicella sp. W31 TaxID=3023713 RepID=UPI00375666FE